MMAVMNGDPHWVTRPYIKIIQYSTNAIWTLKHFYNTCRKAKFTMYLGVFFVSNSLLQDDIKPHSCIHHKQQVHFYPSLTRTASYYRRWRHILSYNGSKHFLHFHPPFSILEDNHWRSSTHFYPQEVRNFHF